MVFDRVDVGDDAARDGERMRVVHRVVIGDAGLAGMDIGAAEVLRRDDLAGRGAAPAAVRRERWCPGLRTMIVSSDMAGT